MKISSKCELEMFYIKGILKKINLIVKKVNQGGELPAH